ncbi:hypothetical protein MROS_0614 [Melioribacter roseus P3M-2]|uniref:Uncharacterized protein n=1 Tax=Melioribacter roseus (strain DSM 23840 / JCM 17771 / VKM B-2668 / P3M-2) TaxID=1191523 RepID=I6YTI4_MELRP|nr:hypothetical protein MROS_0614 [Melioribacter roseus P3M-2]
MAFFVFHKFPFSVKFSIAYVKIPKFGSTGKYARLFVAKYYLAEHERTRAFLLIIC